MSHSCTNDLRNTGINYDHITSIKYDYSKISKLYVSTKTILSVFLEPPVFQITWRWIYHTNNSGSGEFSNFHNWIGGLQGTDHSLSSFEEGFWYRSNLSQSFVSQFIKARCLRPQFSYFGLFGTLFRSNRLSKAFHVVELFAWSARDPLYFLYFSYSH